MKRVILAAVAATALVAGTAGAQAQWGYYDEPGVGVQVGPFGAYVGAPGATQEYGYNDYSTYNSSAPRGGTYKMRAFRSQEVLPQSPPEGGY